MASYLSLAEAAAKLGIPTERLVEMRSQGDVRGFRDGSSWKFPENEIERLSEEMGQDSGLGSGILFDDGQADGGGGSSNILGSDATPVEAGSDLGIGEESSTPGSGDSDVNLVASESNGGSDVALVSSSSDIDMSNDSPSDLMLELEAPDLEIKEPALTHDSGELDLAIDPKEGSTGVGGVAAAGSELNLGNEPAGDASDLSFGGNLDDDDSGEDLIGADDDDELSVLDSDLDVSAAASGISGASNLELMLDLDDSGSSDNAGASEDVLSELDLMSADAGGSGVITGDSGGDNLLGDSDLGSDIGSGLDDALGDDDDLVIADDDDDLVISSGGSDISIAGDSGINLMSPSDSGLSLESEPLDLAGSSISALNLGSGVGDGSSASGVGSGADFQADEEFQLSPSGIGLDEDSDSQVIEVEDSAAIAEPVEFGDDAFGDAEVVEEAPTDLFASDAGAFGDAAEVVEEVEEADGGMALDPHAAVATSGETAVAATGYEVPFTMWQVVGLMIILCFLSLSGMLMTDLVRNMWAYSETSAPVSSLTDWLIQIMGFNP